MTWTSPFTFRIPTQPPSVNSSYKIVRQYGKGGKPYMTLAKHEEVLQYQMVAASIAKHAKPDGWAPEGQVRPRYRFHLGKEADTDNLLKALNDGIAHGLGINDKVFLPCVVEKTIGNKEPYVEVEVDG